MKTREVMAWGLVVLLLLEGGACAERYRVERNSTEKQHIAQVRAEMLRDTEVQKAAMFRQGIWYYRTTVFHQTLPQEELEVK